MGKRDANSEASIERLPLCLIGLSHRTASLELRERLAFRPDQALQMAQDLCQRAVLEEAVVLSTCNRSEIYGLANHADACGRVLQAMADGLVSFHGLSASALGGCAYRESDSAVVQHLYRVAAGMDSLLLGEAEVLGQVREAYRVAFEGGVTGPILNRLFQSASEVGKRVRAETDLGTRPVSVAAAAVKLAEHIFGNLHRHKALVLGAGTVSQQVAENLRARDIGNLGIISRSLERGERLAELLSAAASGWEDLEARVASADIIVASVSSPVAILTRALLERVMQARSGRGLFLIDLGVPRNIEPAARDLYNLYLYDLDDLSAIVEQNRQARRDEVPRAEAIVQLHVQKFRAWYANARMAVLLQELRARLRQERDIFLDAHREMLAHLAPEERHALLQETDRMLERLMKAPAERLLSAREVRRTLADMETVQDVLSAAREKS